MGNPQNGWFIVENPKIPLKWMISGYPHLWKPIIIHVIFGVFPYKPSNFGVFLWFSDGFPLVFPGFPMVFPIFFWDPPVLNV